MNLAAKMGILLAMNNYHTHTWRCKHAEGTVTDYAGAAKAGGCRILGMSDHTPLPDNRWLFIRMADTDLDNYISEIEEARNDVPDITILKGLECDWAGEYSNYYKEEILGFRNFDYLVGAVHWFPYHGEWVYTGEIENASHLKAFSKHIITAMESGLFSFIAHPDSFGIGYKPWDENARSCSVDIITAASELEIPLEINGYGLRKPEIKVPEGMRKQYPLLPFWEIAGKKGIKVLCNSDAHKPDNVAASLEEAHAIGNRYSIEIIDELPLLKRAV